MARKIMRVGVNGVAGALDEMAQDFVREVNADTRKAVQKGVRAARKSIQSSTSFRDRSGIYRKGWRTKTEGNDITGHSGAVFQKAHPGIPHLLEKGHGGPHPAPAHPHIQIAAGEGAAAMWAELGGGHG